MRPSSPVVILCGLTWLTVSSSTARRNSRRCLRHSRYVAATVRPTARERQTLMSGRPITKLLETQHHD